MLLSAACVLLFACNRDNNGCCPVKCCPQPKPCCPQPKPCCPQPKPCCPQPKPCCPQPKPCCPQPKPCCPKPVRCCPDGNPPVNGNYNPNEDMNDGTHSTADWQITMSVKKAIMTNGDLAASARFVSVSTTNGVVTLTGNVDTKEQSRMIERTAKGVAGVKSVDNQLMVNQQ